VQWGERAARSAPKPPNRETGSPVPGFHDDVPWQGWSCAAKMGGVNPLFKLFVKGHVWLYRSTDGRRGSSMQGMKVLLLTTVGNKSGKARTVPIVPFIDGSDTYVMASMGGAPQHPAWYLNLRSHPDVDVQMGADKYRARAVTLEEGPERERLWKRITEAMPNFGEYQKKTSRVIPVVRLVKQA
jgi:deazaflavin-dependent oxidoreductase (nitroreductase family)